MIKYNSLDSFMAGGNKCFIVENDKDRWNFEDLYDSYVIIDGKRYKVIGVEHKTKNPPWGKGEKISLKVRYERLLKVSPERKAQYTNNCRGENSWEDAEEVKPGYFDIRKRYVRTCLR